MDLRQEKKDDMRKDMLETMHHERCMVEDTEYFHEYMINKHDFSKCVDIADFMDEINRQCGEYGQSSGDLLDMMKEI